MLEKEIEKKLKKQTEAIGCKCLKFESPGYTGVPDRIILLPVGMVVFAETKAPGKRERARQVFVQKILRKMGFLVFSSVDNEEKVQEIVECCKGVIENAERV